MSIEKLETNIDNNGISFCLQPNERQPTQIAWNDIASIKVRKGIVYSRYDLVYNVYAIFDEYGIYITTTSGSKYIIGTREPNKVLEQIKKYKSALVAG